MDESLARVKRATKRRRAAEQEWRDAIRNAHADGKPLRKIAAEAEVTHPRVLQIVRE